MFSLRPSQNSSTTGNILKLYDGLIHSTLKNTYCYPVLEKVLDSNYTEENHELSDVEIYLNTNHIAQFNGSFPLSRSQRVALAQYTSQYTKETFAINGPPGTGKTTLLQSVIANTVSIAVLSNKETPLMIGCSTNNQAITNILDSMRLENTGNVLQQPWLPKVKSLGLYLCSKQKGKQAGKDLQVATTNFLNDGFLEQLEDHSKISEYEDIFLNRLYNHIKLDSPPAKEDAPKIIRKEINRLHTQILNTLHQAKEIYNIPNQLSAKGFASFGDLKTAIQTTIQELHIKKEEVQQLKTGIIYLEKRQNKFSLFIKYLPLSQLKPKDELHTN